MSDPERDRTEPAPPRQNAAPASFEEAVARAREHALSALGEGLEAAACLLDAASLAAGSAEGDIHPGLDPLVSRLERVREMVTDAALPDGVAGVGTWVTQALDGEIAHWDARAQQDPEARAVLRAFLGAREVLWELGVRPARQDESPTADERARDNPAHHGAADASRRRPERPDRADRADRPERPERRRGPRVQRVPIEG